MKLNTNKTEYECCLFTKPWSYYANSESERQSLEKDKQGKGLWYHSRQQIDVLAPYKCG